MFRNLFFNGLNSRSGPFAASSQYDSCLRHYTNSIHKDTFCFIKFQREFSDRNSIFVTYCLIVSPVSDF